ncbi:flagellar assembly protein FliW [Paenibacillus sp. MZ04-78.2]|uniref:flagellar assembly protein FliW n=1 Tax=Paenibacillus sp. MZ04-78.2 TaxID=2962034 RepID=UPI0020B8EFE6|nr:flagellar assembly protein FliW [Paenibacillus sp. MZ04-78.2]MCP3776253.1 flagellar assembly protein FliW [Paenibacillus sp. MZ04-78.2]
MFKQLDGKIISLNGSILAFEGLNEFTFNCIEGSDLAYLSSVDDEKIGFVVATPFEYFKDYAFELNKDDVARLGLKSEQDVLILSIVTLKDPFQDSTMNLLAPLVINMKKLKGLQIILPPSYEYDIKTPLFPKQRQESGEKKC